MLLACAGFLAVGQVLIGPLERPLPDLVILGVASLLPLAIAERIVRVPGSATAVCGAYLLPTSLLSLLVPGVPSPPLLLVPAITFDLVLWLDVSHLAAVRDLWPGRHVAPRNRPKPRRSFFSRGRAVLAGAAFGLVLALVEPSYQMFLGALPALWTGPTLWIAAMGTTLVCAGLATVVTVRGTAS
jgi:hypothetical protein